MQFLKAPLTALSVATLVAVVGCGGSSSSSKGNTVNPNPTDPGAGGGSGGGDTQMYVTGEAVKGVLKNAQVTAYELDDQGERFPNAVGTAKTDAQGEYELPLSEDYTGGLIEVEVTTVDGQTTMVCDAARCNGAAQGEEVALPADFVLSSIVEQEEGSDTVSASVTAWSTMAASRAKALLQTGGSTSLKDARRQANAEVSQVVGFDVSRARARGLSQLEGADTEQSQYALMNAAVAEIVFRDNGEENISAQLNQFTAALNDGRLGNDDDGFSSAELGQAVSRVITANAERVNNEASDALANQAARLESAGGNGFEPDYDEALDLDEDASDADRIAAYKTFVGQTRTWLSSIDELTSEDLTAAVNIDEDTLRATLDSETQARFQFLGEVVGQISEYAIGNVETLVAHLENGGTETIDIKDEAGNTVGRAELIFADNNGLSITAKGTATGVNGGAFVPFEVSLNTSFLTDDITIDHANGEIISARLARFLSNTEVSVNAQVGAEDGDHQVSLNNVALSLELDSNISSNEQGEFDSAQAENALVGASFSGNVAINSGGYRFDGSANVELVRLNSNARLFVGSGLEQGPLAPSHATLSGQFTSVDNMTSFNATASLNIRNAAAFDTFAWLEEANNQIFYRGSLSSEQLSRFKTQYAPENSVYTDSIEVGYWDDQSYFNQSYYTEDPSETHRVDAEISSYAEQQRLEQALLEVMPTSFELVLSSSTVEGGVTEETMSAQSVFDAATITNGHVSLSGGYFDMILPSTSIPEDVSVEAVYEEGSGYRGVYAHLFRNVSNVNGGEDNGGYTEVSNTVFNVEVVFDGPTAAEILNQAFEGSNSELINLGTVTSVDIGEPSGWPVSVDLPKTQDAYSFCVNNSTLWFGYPSDQPTTNCRRSALASQSRYLELTPQGHDVLTQLVEEGLKARLGDNVPYSTGDLSVSYHRSYDGSESGYWFADTTIGSIENAEYYVQGGLTASLGVSLPDLPSAQVTASFNRTGYRSGNIRTNVDWDGGNYTLDVAGTNLDNPEALNLRFFNAQGYELAMTVIFTEGEVSDLTGQALINGEEVGQVEWREGQPVLAYRNGDEVQVESLF